MDSAITSISVETKYKLTDSETETMDVLLFCLMNLNFSFDNDLTVPEV